MANQFKPRGKFFNHNSPFDLILLFTLCTLSSLFILIPQISMQYFTLEEQLDSGLPLWDVYVPSLQPSIYYLPMKRSSDWSMLQQCNEPSPNSLPCAITYSIKFVVSSIVIVMNMQGVNFFVSPSQKKETLEVDKACKLIGSLVAAG